MITDTVRQKVGGAREIFKGVMLQSSVELYGHFWRLTEPTRTVISTLENAANNARLSSAGSTSPGEYVPPQATSADTRVDAPLPSPVHASKTAALSLAATDSTASQDGHVPPQATSTKTRTGAAPLPSRVPRAAALSAPVVSIPTPVAPPVISAAPSEDITLLTDYSMIKQEPVEVWPIPSTQSASTALPLSTLPTASQKPSRRSRVTAPAVINVDRTLTPAHGCTFLKDPAVQGVGVKLQPAHKELNMPYIFTRVMYEREHPYAVIRNSNKTLRMFSLSDLRYMVPTNPQQYVLCTAPGADHGQLYYVQSHHGEVCVVRKHPKPRGKKVQIQMSTRSLAQVLVPRGPVVKAEVVED